MRRLRIEMVLVFIFLFILSLHSKAGVWTATEVWTPEKEVQYQQWIQKFAQVDTFSKAKLADGTDNPYYGIKADCADAVYSFRIIFAYENKLPWAMRNPADKKKLITNNMVKFDSIPEEGGQRIRRFINYMRDVVSTQTIANDTYPVSINKIVPGTIILTSKTNHHSWTIVEVMANGNPRLVFNSTVGSQSGAKLQQRLSWPNPYWVFQPEEILVDKSNPDAGIITKPVYYPGSYAGLRYWIPVDKLLEEQAILEGYSTDQYSLDLKKWKHELTRRLALRGETVPEVVQRLLTDACDDIKQRVGAVKEVEVFKSKFAAPTCLEKDKYGEYSTPSRDRRLFDALILARSYFQHGLKTQGTQIFSKKALAQYKKIFPEPLMPAKDESLLENAEVTFDVNSICAIKVEDKFIDMAEIKRRSFRSYLSPNPNENVVGRWGGNGDVLSDFAKTCSSFGDVYTPYDIARSEKEALDEVDVYSQVNGTKPSARTPIAVNPKQAQNPEPVLRPLIAL
jgi:hypothetical protein